MLADRNVQIYPLEEHKEIRVSTCHHSKCTTCRECMYCLSSTCCDSSTSWACRYPIWPVSSIRNNYNPRASYITSSINRCSRTSTCICSTICSNTSTTSISSTSSSSTTSTTSYTSCTSSTSTICYGCSRYWVSCTSSSCCTDIIRYTSSSICGVSCTTSTTCCRCSSWKTSTSTISSFCCCSWKYCSSLSSNSSYTREYWIITIGSVCIISTCTTSTNGNCICLWCYYKCWVICYLPSSSSWVIYYSYCSSSRASPTSYYKGFNLCHKLLSYCFWYYFWNYFYWLRYC